jgi:hypothetical protein
MMQAVLQADGLLEHQHSSGSSDKIRVTQECIPLLIPERKINLHVRLGLYVYCVFTWVTRQGLLSAQSNSACDLIPRQSHCVHSDFR